MVPFSVNDRNHIRDLAKQVADIAASENNARIIRRWCDVNALRKPDRFPVWCRPVAAWEEILPKASLRCSENWLRGIEYGFRQILLKHEIGDDSPVCPHFEVPAIFDIDPPNVWGVDIRRHSTGKTGDAWTYDPPIKEWSYLDRLRLPQFAYNHVRTQELLSKGDDLLGDILPVKLICRPPLDATLCNPATDFRGMTQLMMDLIESPEQVHRMMAYLRDAMLGAMRQVEAAGLLTPGSHWPMLTSDPIGPENGNRRGRTPYAVEGSDPVVWEHGCQYERPSEVNGVRPLKDPSTALRASSKGVTPAALAPGRYTYSNCWCLANSQEFDQVSPAMWEEFLLNYQKPILAQFGLVAYGCCENLTKKIDGVLSIPNLRVFVCSAWTNLDTVIERVGRKHVIMWRQKASDVVFPDDVATLRRQLNEGLRKLQGHHVQVVLRELQMLAGHRDRLHVWTKLAIEAAERYS